VALDQIGQDGLPAYSEALVLFQRTGNRIRLATVLNNIACREIGAGDLDAARSHLEEALDSAQELGDRELVSYITGNLGLAAYLKGDDDFARERFTESLDIARRNGYQSQLGYALLGLALMSTRAGALREAATLHGFVDALFGELGEQLQAPESLMRDADHVHLRSMLGDPAFETAFNAGGTLGPEEALSLARSCPAQ
jgi:tetratricopeptide (TPR) repeat protein